MNVYSCIFEDIDGSKTGHGRRGFLEEGAWDAIHVIEVSSFPFNKRSFIRFWILMYSAHLFPKFR